jgi:hypothetical protein
MLSNNHIINANKTTSPNKITAPILNILAKKDVIQDYG